MPQHPQVDFDQTVLDLIDNSPVGALPHTPTYDEALARLIATHQVYVNADHKGCHVTARSLSRQPSFIAANLGDVVSGRIDAALLEPNISIYDRYLLWLEPQLLPRANALRNTVAGKAIHHRQRAGVAQSRDPIHTLFLVPGAGPQIGLPGNYLHGSIVEAPDGSSFSIEVHDSDTDCASCPATSLQDAYDKIQELLGSAPFHLSELDAIGFKLR